MPPRILGSAILTGAAVILAVAPQWSVRSGLAAFQRRPCEASPNVALPDVDRDYRGLPPGLYPERQATPPRAHAQDRVARGSRISPLSATGETSPDGQVVLLSIGMSNTGSEFARFIDEARASGITSRRLAMVNGALSGADAAMWARPDSPAWRHVAQALGGRHAPAQVQAIWMKQVHLKTAPFPDEVERLASNLEATLRIARSTFPNLRIVFASSRTRSGAATRQGPGEPQAYETAFAVRRVIERQQPDATLVTWGPYLWANSAARSDGLTWECSDLQSDLLHPSESGTLKVAHQLLAFFATDPSTSTWFLEQRARRPAMDAAIDVSARAGSAPLTVEFSARASWAKASYWSFGDGTTSVDPRPRKTFHRRGHYEVWLTAATPSGGWARSSVEIRVE